MADTGVAVTRTSPSASLSVQQALEELRHMPVMEACVSGLCDICLYQQRCPVDISVEEAISVQSFTQ